MIYTMKLYMVPGRCWRELEQRQGGQWCERHQRQLGMRELRGMARARLHCLISFYFWKMRGLHSRCLLLEWRGMKMKLTCFGGVLLQKCNGRKIANIWRQINYAKTKKGDRDAQNEGPKMVCVWVCVFEFQGLCVM